MSDEALGFADAERLLREAEFLDCRPLWWSSNYVYLAQLQAPGGEPFATVYKPLSGESPLWDFPPGLYRREVAAYELAKLLDWPFIPPTVAREGPKGIGSVQVFVRHDQHSHFFEQREDPELVPQLQRIAVFDFIANNADRKGGHCLLDEERRIWGIDHGLCFHEQYKLRTVIWDWANEPVPGEWLRDIELATERLSCGHEAAAGLSALLEESERQALLARAAKLLRTRCFPTPGPHRSYPWPLV